jgi:hypothetical protein
MFYEERIKPLVKAEEEAGNVSSGRRIALGRKFSKELLDDEDEEVKAQIRDMYEKQRDTHKKSGKNILNNDTDEDCALDAQGIAQ